jgi:hypothetical protein
LGSWSITSSVKKLATEIARKSGLCNILSQP